VDPAGEATHNTAAELVEERRKLPSPSLFEKNFSENVGKEVGIHGKTELQELSKNVAQTRGPGSWFKFNCSSST